MYLGPPIQLVLPYCTCAYWAKEKDLLFPLVQYGLLVGRRHVENSNSTEEEVLQEESTGSFIVIMK